jgi:hypothetical protein
VLCAGDEVDQRQGERAGKRLARGGDGGAQIAAGTEQGAVDALQFQAMLGVDPGAAQTDNVQAEPPCIMARVPMRVNWWARQLPERKA